MAKILVCDDSDFMRNKIAEVLKEDGHEIVGEAKDGKEVVEQVKKIKPDLVTMDILMKPDGVQAIKDIKKTSPATKILIISILEDQQAEIVEGIRLGADGYIGKPINAESLRNEARRILDKE